MIDTDRMLGKITRALPPKIRPAFRRLRAAFANLETQSARLTEAERDRAGEIISKVLTAEVLALEPAPRGKLRRR